MTLTCAPPPTEDGIAACTDHLDLVDDAFERPGGVLAMELRTHYCPRCPIAAACLAGGMRGERGVWGATSPHMRTKHGAPTNTYRPPAPLEESP